VSERAVWTAGIRRRDAAVLDAVVRDALPGLLRAARAAGLPPEQAEDAVHAAVLVFLNRAEEFDGRARASTWMQGILARTILAARRSAPREEPADDIDALFDAQFDADGSWVRAPAVPSLDLARSEVRRLLADCLAQLPQRQRDAFSLREVDDLPTDELCKILDVTPNNLGVLLFRARARLRHCLEQHGVTGSADAEL
jgi:RNA polymerase sigma factor (sigma-70 family)